MLDNWASVVLLLEVEAKGTTTQDRGRLDSSRHSWVAGIRPDTGRIEADAVDMGECLREKGGLLRHKRIFAW